MTQIYLMILLYYKL